MRCPTYLDKSENVPEFRNAWGGVFNGLPGVGGWGSGWRGFLFPVKKWMTSSDSTYENASYSSKNWIGWCCKNWRKGKWGVCECVKLSHIRGLPLLFAAFHTIIFLNATVVFNPSPFLHFARLHFHQLILFVCGPEVMNKNAGQEILISWRHYFLFPLAVSSSAEELCPFMRRLQCVHMIPTSNGWSLREINLVLIVYFMIMFIDLNMRENVKSVSSSQPENN